MAPVVVVVVVVVVQLEVQAELVPLLAEPPQLHVKAMMGS